MFTNLFWYQAGCSRLIRNFSEDIRDSEIYTELIAQVAPQDYSVDKSALSREVDDYIIQQRVVSYYRTG